MVEIAHLIGRVLKAPGDVEAVRADVAELVGRFPVYPELA
jgi:glycine/serine hydroxymethyltransferase